MIKINEIYYIDADTSNYTLKEKSTIQDEKSPNFGKETFKDVGYFSSLEHLLNCLLKKELRQFIGKEEEKTIKDMLEEIKRLREYIKSLKLDI